MGAGTEQRLQAAVEWSPSGLLMTDAEGRIVMVNREIERLFGYSREELLGESVELLVPNRLRGGHADARHGFVAGRETRQMGKGRDLLARRRDGDEFPVEVGLRTVETEGGLFVLGSIVDLSARRQADKERSQLEARLRQAQKLEAVGSLAGGIAHDFNNILSAILGYAELIRSDLPRESAREGDLQDLLAAVDRGRHLVRRILMFSRRQELERKPVALRPAVDEAVTLMRATLPRLIEIRTHIDPATPNILGDITSLHQVLMNLAANAALAMPGGGILEFVAEPYRAGSVVGRTDPELREGDYARVIVRDNGAGMDEATRDRAFDPFFTTREVGFGTGLGLATVHAIVRSLEGTVELHSEVGHGTEVRCYFPAHHGEVSLEPGSLPADLPAGHGEHLLFVDDEPALVRLGERQLSAMGYRVTTANSSTAALEIFLSAPGTFDLIITDHNMPQFTGLELARRIHDADRQIPILLLTGFLDPVPIEQLRTAGIVQTLIKPLTMADLARAVGEVLRGRRLG